MEGLHTTVLRRGVIGFALGLPLGLGALCLFRPGALAGDTGALAVHLLSGGVYGAVGMGASTVYDIERWSLARAMLIHLLVMLCGLCLVGCVQGWLGSSPLGFIALALGFIAVYGLIWLVQWLLLRNQIRRMNRGVRAWKARKRRYRQEP